MILLCKLDEKCDKKKRDVHTLWRGKSPSSTSLNERNQDRETEKASFYVVRGDGVEMGEWRVVFIKNRPPISRFISVSGSYRFQLLEIPFGWFEGGSCSVLNSPYPIRFIDFLFDVVPHGDHPSLTDFKWVLVVRRGSRYQRSHP